MSDGRLARRVAIVTGGGRGMGRAHCLELAQRGARVAVVDRDGAEADAVATDVREAGGDALAFSADVTVRQAVEAAVEATAAAWGGIDIVVSNAGLINDEQGLAKTDDDAWRRMLAVNLDGLLHISRAALPWLRRSAAGRIVVISSTWAQVPPGHSYGYIAAKGGLLAMAKNLAVELAPDSILVNAITPGSVATRMIEDPERELELYPIPIGRMADPGEISYLVAFLAGDESAFITGQVISPNGGATIVGV
jgi:NAD(P)-dependent dehydrogenase (short-subunit alcohol dehydrogenase family)